ncbi:L,D-transpeptidase family protein [Microvirga thermotolerans]|uniref:L,D-transpeptidase family protein n=1 Tax=Microvirga thermotolerans TaxID=2651334 RepID=A0A5P9K040_9HYPH|nr:murein L,D-transpeptidase family protein [Microvirga thermotolerans]QFU17791.1 L,D-transpeptidase family protein [Microvirga thermotolerans]
MMKRIALAASLALALAACQDDGFSRSSTRHLTPIPAATMALMASKGMTKNDPILIRAYKKESEMEIWKRGADGRYALLKTYPICRWSGQLGPKTREGDRQVPEGFYTVTPAQMNPNSAFYLSFDTGYPNAYDRSLGRNGGDIMVHGSCSSRGCFAMTDQNIAEIYAVAREAFASGQRAFQFQSFPFRMTPKNLAQHRLDPNIGFWKNLKEGSDYFEVTKEEPRVTVTAGRYQFNVPDESVVTALAEKRRKDEQEVAELVARGEKPVKLVYHDGDSHESFRTALAGAVGSDGSLVVDARMRDKFGDVSRPEGLSSGPQVIALDDTTGKPKPETPSTALAYASLDRSPAAARTAAADRPAAGETKVAALGAPPAAAPVGNGETPFYKKMFNGIGDLFSSSTTAAQPAAETAQAAPAKSGAAAQKPAAAVQRKAQAGSAVSVAAAN